MNRRRVVRTYAAITSTLIVAISLSGWCWGTVQSSGLANVSPHDICLAIWALSGVLLGLSQIAFVVIAVRTKHNVVLVFAVGILLAIAGFVFVLSRMPS